MEELSRQLHVLTQIFATMPVGFCVFDSEVRLCYINQALLDESGVPAEALQGKCASELAPQWAAGMKPLLRQVLDTAELQIREAALEKSEARFSDFANAASDWLWEMDKDLRFTYFSPNVERIVGVPAEWHYGKTRRDLLGDDAESEEWRDHLAVLERHEPFRDFVYYRQGEGIESRWLSSSGLPVFDENGEFTGYRGVGSDVTDRMADQEALRRSEKRFQDFAASSGDWFWEMDADYRFTYVSENVERIVGMTAEYYIGKTRAEAHGEGPDDGQWREHLALLQRHEPFRDVMLHRPNADGKAEWVSLSGVPFHDDHGVFAGYRGVGSDVTDRWRAEEARRAEEKRFQDYATISADWFAETDADHRFTYMSASISVLGLEPADFIGKNPEELLGADFDPDTLNEDLVHMRARKPFRNVERRSNVSSDKWLRLNGDPNFSADGTFLGYRITGADITELKRDEAALRESEQRFRDFAAVSADRFVETDADHNFTFMSETIAVMDLSPAEFIGRNRQELLFREYDQVSVKEEYDAIEAHQPFRNIERRSPFAPDIWLRVNGDPFFDQDGAFLGYRITGTDITELKQQENALRESEQRFRDFASVSADWFAETDADHIFTYMSESVAEIGLKPEDYVGKNRLEILKANSDADTLGEELAAIQERRPFRNIERRSSLADGAWFRVSGVPLFDADGVFKGYRLTGDNVTELKQQEEALRTSERRFRDFADNASDWFWEMDENLRYTWISGSFERFAGVPAEWHYGKTLSEVGLSDMDAPEGKARLETFARHEPFRDVLQRRVTAKGEFWFYSSGVPVFDDEGNFKGYFGTGRDITALRQAEQTSQRFLEAIDRLSEGVVLFDAEDRFVVCNAQYERLSGVRGELLVPGVKFEELVRDNMIHGGHPLPEEEREGWLAERLVRRRALSSSFEIHRDGFDLLINEERLPDGGIVATFRDITALKKSEQQLRQAQKMEAIGQLTGGVAHDFNNLLAVMMGNLALLEDELGPDNELTELTTPMVRAVDRASELTKRMLAFARLQPLAVGNVNVNVLLHQMQPLLRRSLAEEIDIELSLVPDLETCIADAGQLEQAVLNLAINARDAMPQGGRLEIQTRNETIADDASNDLADAEPGNYVVIAVTDYGQGIPAADQQRIFEPFFTTKEVGRGTGLGLSMVYGFIKQSNGHITVQSEEGIGTTFRLYLPATKV